jgi:hypothetical protein
MMRTAVLALAVACLAAAAVATNCTHSGVTKVCPSTAPVCCGTGADWNHNAKITCCPAGTQCCTFGWRGLSSCIPLDQVCCSGWTAAGPAGRPEVWGCNATQQCGSTSDKCVPNTMTWRVCPTGCDSNVPSNRACRTVPLSSKKCSPANFTTKDNGYPQTVVSVDYSCVNNPRISVELAMYSTKGCTGDVVGVKLLDLQKCVPAVNGGGGSFVFTQC